MRDLLELVESRSGTKLELKKLRYSRSSLSPVFTELALNRHLDLAKGYVERYNDGEGDPSFNEAGAFLFLPASLIQTFVISALRDDVCCNTL